MTPGPPAVSGAATGLPNPAATRSRRARWIDVTALVLGAIVLRIPSLLAPTNLGYDDGGYGLAAIAMREGYDPFRDIFSSQGPLFLPLVRLADLAGFETLDAPRLLAVLAGAVTTVAVYFAGRELMDRGRALLAAALAGSSGVLLWTTGPLTSDGTAAALSVSAVAVALVYRRRPSTLVAIAIAVLAGSAFSVKNLLVTPALLIAWLLVASRRRIADAILVPCGAIVVLLLVSAPWGFTDVYHDSIQYHLDKTGERRPLANASKLVTTFWSWSPTLVILGLVGLINALISTMQHRRHRDRTRHRVPAKGRPRPPDDANESRSAEGDLRKDRLRPPDDANESRSAEGDLRKDRPAPPDTSTSSRSAPGDLVDRLFEGDRVLWWWAGLVFIVLLLQDPMFRNHLAALVAPLALLVARYRPSWRLVVITALVTVPYQAFQLRPLLLPKDYSGDAATVVDALRRLPDGAWALSDEPGLVWRAGKGTDPFFVDPSVLRIHSHVKEIAITEDRLVKAAANPRECAVVVWAVVRFGSFTTLPERLVALGYEQVESFGPGRGLWVRPRCEPQGRPAAARTGDPGGRASAVAVLVRSRG